MSTYLINHIIVYFLTMQNIVLKYTTVVMYFYLYLCDSKVYREYFVSLVLRFCQSIRVLLEIYLNRISTVKCNCSHPDFIESSSDLYIYILTV